MYNGAGTERVRCTMGQEQKGSNTIHVYIYRKDSRTGKVAAGGDLGLKICEEKPCCS